MSSQKSSYSPVAVGLAIAAVVIPPTVAYVIIVKDTAPNLFTGVTQRGPEPPPTFKIDPSELTDSTELGRPAQPPTSNGFQLVQATRKRTGKIWNRDELKAALKDKTHAEVKALLGEPDSAVWKPGSTGPNERTDWAWRYFNTIADQGEKRDGRTCAVVWFDGDADQVDHVTFTD